MAGVWCLPRSPSVFWAELIGGGLLASTQTNLPAFCRVPMLFCPLISKNHHSVWVLAARGLAILIGFP